MKILFCTSFYTNVHNGAGQFARHLFRLNNQFPAHEIRILSEDISQELANTDPKLYSLTIPTKGFQEIYGMLARAKDYHEAALAIKDQYDFDILFFNNAFASYKSLGPSNAGFKVMAFIHDDNYIHFGLRNFAFRKRWFYRFVYNRYERNICRKLDLVFTNSKYLKKEIIDQYDVPSEKIKQVYVSIDMEQLKFQSPSSINTNLPIKILFVKNEYRRGGLEDLVLALNKLTANYSFVVSVLGPLSENEPVIRSLFSNDQVKLNFMGNVPQAAVFSAMRTHDVFAVPSRKEAQGVAILEAMALGIPVVSTNIGGIPETTNNGEFAWLAAPNNPSHLAETIQACLTTETQRIEKSTAGRTFIEQQFYYKNMIAHFNEIFNAFDKPIA